MHTILYNEIYRNCKYTKCVHVLLLYLYCIIYIVHFDARPSCDAAATFKTVNIPQSHKRTVYKEL